MSDNISVINGWMNIVVDYIRTYEVLLYIICLLLQLFTYVISVEAIAPTGFHIRTSLHGLIHK